MLDNIFVFAFLFNQNSQAPARRSTEKLHYILYSLEHFWRINITNKSIKMDSK